MGDHALLGASNAEMWINCPGSARLNEILSDVTSEYAQEGTLAHEICEQMLYYNLKLITKQKFYAWLKKQKENPLYNEEMVDYCSIYNNYVLAIKGEEVLIEQRLDASAYIPEGFGTGDAVAVAGNTLHVIDFKYGKGIKVEAENNSQLKYYALGALGALNMLYDFENVVVHIVQPRLGEPVSCEYTVEDILQWGESIKEQAQKAWKGTPEFKSGKWCQWCKTKATCATRLREEVQEAFEDAFIDPEEMKDLKPNQISEDEILYWLPLVKPITKFLSDLESYASEQAISHGKTWVGWKVVEGRSNRVYSNEETVKETLEMFGVEVEYLKTKLVGITELEKLLGKKLFSDLVEPLLIKPPGSPVLVVETDKREAVKNDAATAFKEE